MLSHDVIVIEDLPERIENSIINKAINYALLSFAFTTKKLDLASISRKIENISKGKIVELMFQHFMVQNKLPVNFSSCQTPFYLPSKRDFIMDTYEWDIKNSFVRTSEILNPEEIIELPALIPNRTSSPHFTDQWEKRNEIKHSTSSGVRFVFTFMERPKENDFISIHIREQHLTFFEKIKKQHPYQNGKKAPFTETWFWNELSKIDFPIHHLHQNLRLYITSWAGEEHFPFFFNTEKRNFDTKIYTKMKNKTIKVHRLPSFISLFPKLKENMQCGGLVNASKSD